MTPLCEEYKLKSTYFTGIDLRTFHIRHKLLKPATLALFVPL
jgi:hypothetical protein